MVESPSPGRLAHRLEAVNRRPFGRPEAAFYEFIAAPAVRSVVGPVLVEEVAAAPPGAVLDVGCGGGAIAADVQASGRVVVGVDPSTPQLTRLGRRGRTLGRAAASAQALPFASGSFAVVVSSCAIKHWPDRQLGLAECARVLRPGGRLAIAEIDGGQDHDDLLRFAQRTRIPAGLRRLYPGFARRTFVSVSPTADDIAADCTMAGFDRIRRFRIEGLPFLVVTADRWDG